LQSGGSCLQSILLADVAARASVQSTVRRLYVASVQPTRMVLVVAACIAHRCCRCQSTAAAAAAAAAAGCTTSQLAVLLYCMVHRLYMDSAQPNKAGVFDEMLHCSPLL
jgi:hypothetical protein